MIAGREFILRSEQENAMTENHERESQQPLAKIQHSRAKDNADPAPKDRAAIVADPKNRLVDGSVDPVTKEVKPAGQ
jgi:hypothetical protein